MPNPSHKRPTLVIAGPGAGKTHEMVERVAASLSTLEPSRYLAAITFTNAASNSIRERLHRIAKPGPNVFIGTIHSFVNRFIVMPFAGPLQGIREDRIFVDFDIKTMVDAKLEGKPSTPQARNGIRKKIVKSLVNRGLIPYDEAVNIARDLVTKSVIRSVVSRRIQALFVDEFQDTDNRHFEIFDAIRKGGSTKIYTVGDPEQFVYSFTYSQRGLAHPEFGKIAFFKFREQAIAESVSVNRRSCTEIVTFTNQFHAELEQTSYIGARNEQRVLFIPATNKNTIIEEFRSRSDLIPDRRGIMHRLYLGFENAMFDDVREQYGILHISNASRHRETLLQEALDLLALCLGASTRRSLELLNLSPHDWRKEGIVLLRDLRDGTIDDSTSFRTKWLPRLRVKDLKERGPSVDRGFCRLHETFLGHSPASCLDWSSSIHKSKGLEANAVLVLAETRNELMKWLATDKGVRNTDKGDKCRLGFVAFSRAMELLCIAVLEPVDPVTLSKLQALGISLTSSLLPRAEPFLNPEGVSVETVREGS